MTPLSFSIKADGGNVSTGERIAAAFVLNNPTYLPSYYDDMLEAWDRLDDEWQGYARLIKQQYMHLIEAE